MKFFGDKKAVEYFFTISRDSNNVFGKGLNGLVLELRLLFRNSIREIYQLSQKQIAML